jgi:hypothetical protein
VLNPGPRSLGQRLLAESVHGEAWYRGA